MTHLCWLRRDLRVADNPALHAACQDAARGVVAVFVICPAQWAEHSMSDAQACFILRSLERLRDDLDAINIPLRVLSVDRFDGVSDALLHLCEDLECEALFFNEEYELNEVRRDQSVRDKLPSAGVRVSTYHDQVIVEPGALSTQSGKPYAVYTPYKRSWLKHVGINGLPQLLPAPPRQVKTQFKSDRIPSSIERFQATPSIRELWPAGEQVAKQQLENFLEGGIQIYSDQRDRPGTQGTSSLSPYLAIGCIRSKMCDVS